MKIGVFFTWSKNIFTRSVLHFVNFVALVLSFKEIVPSIWFWLAHDTDFRIPKYNNCFHWFALPVPEVCKTCVRDHGPRDYECDPCSLKGQALDVPLAVGQRSNVMPWCLLIDQLKYRNLYSLANLLYWVWWTEETRPFVIVLLNNFLSVSYSFVSFISKSRACW